MVDSGQSLRDKGADQLKRQVEVLTRMDYATADGSLCRKGESKFDSMLTTVETSIYITVLIFPTDDELSLSVMLQAPRDR